MKQSDLFVSKLFEQII